MIKQEKGGAIGSELTCVVGKTKVIVFTWSCIDLLDILKSRWYRIEDPGSQQENQLSAWCIDDDTAASTRIQKGWHYNQVSRRTKWTLE